MVHHRQRLPFGLETRDHLAAVHARFHDLQRNRTVQGLVLFSPINHAHAPFAQDGAEQIGPNPRPRCLHPFQWRICR